MHWFNQHPRLITMLLKTISSLTSHHVNSVTQASLSSTHIHLYLHHRSACSHSDAVGVGLFVSIDPHRLPWRQGALVMQIWLFIPLFKTAQCSSTSLTIIMHYLIKEPCQLCVFNIFSLPVNIFSCLCSQRNLLWFFSFTIFLLPESLCLKHFSLPPFPP